MYSFCVYPLGFDTKQNSAGRVFRVPLGLDRIGSSSPEKEML